MLGIPFRFWDSQLFRSFFWAVLSSWNTKLLNPSYHSLSLFKNRIFTQTSVIDFAVGFAMFGAITYLPQYMQVVRGANPINSGLEVAPMMAGLLLTSIVSGMLISRWGRFDTRGDSYEEPTDVSLTRKGFIKNPLAPRSTSSLWLLWWRMFAAPFTSAFSVHPSCVRYSPRLTRLPLKAMSGCVPFQTGISSWSRKLAVDVYDSSWSID